MSLQLIMGNSGSGKSHYVYEQIIRQSMENPDGHYMIIVPEQFTLQTQKDIVTMHPRHSVMNIDILSFQRLAYRIFDEVGGCHLEPLDETGKNLIIRKIAADKQKELTILGANLRKTGYVSEIKSFLSELTQYHIKTEELDSLIHKTEGRAALHDKLQDVGLLYRGFWEYIEDRFITAEELLVLLAGVIDRSKVMKNSVIVLDGFTGFTPVQAVLLERLMPLAKRLLVTVTMDNREDPYTIKHEHELFYMSKKMIKTLYRLAEETKTKVEEGIMAKGNISCRHRESKILGKLERSIFRYPVRVFEEEQEELVMLTARNPLAELKAAAVEILRLVREEGYRFKEIAVVSGDMSAYTGYAGKIFEQYKIPAFIDDKRSVLMNPFVECIRALLKLLEDRLSYESMFRYLRCGLLPYPKEDIDRLENYCLAFGIRGMKRWQEKWVRTCDGLSEEELAGINLLREQITGSLLPLYTVFRDKKALARDLTKALYEFLVSLSMQERISILEKEFEAAKELSLAKEYAQIYKIVMDLFDRLVSLLGEERLELKEYREILDAGFEEARVGIIPPSIDRVVVGDIERTRLDNIKILFFLGVNEGTIPKSSSKGGIISQLEREAIKACGIELAPTTREDSYTQKFYLYLMMAKPSEKLYVSFCKTDSQGKTLRPSYLIGLLRKMFPVMAVRDMDEVLLSVDGAACKESGFEYIAWGLKKRCMGGSAPGFTELYRWYYDREDTKAQAVKLVEAAYFENRESRISKAVAKALYGNVLENSVTRLEQFAACAFAHFMVYGLELKERREYKFQSVDMGNIFHQALERFSKKLVKSGFDWRTIPDQMRDTLAEACVEECITDYGSSVLYSTARNAYVINRMKRILKRTVWALQSQIVKGKFTPGKYEVSFSMAEDLDSVNIALSAEEKMRLKGRIDRLDTYENEEQVYIKIIDYKSGGTAFDLAALYYGLQLQLVVYLNAAVELEKRAHPDKEVIPAGILYYNMKDPVIDRETGETEEAVQRRILEQLKMNGLINDREDIIRLMDSEMGQKSSVIPAAFNKDGSLSRYARAASSRQFELLGEFADKKIRELGRDMVDGSIAVNPYEAGQKNACEYCSYREVCGFDRKLPGYEFRRLKPLSDEDVWKMIKEEGTE